MAKANEKVKEGETPKETDAEVLTQPETRLDETVSGGVYIVNGVKVNAHGEKIEE
jgi:hypothetical protein